MAGLNSGIALYQGVCDKQEFTYWVQQTLYVVIARGIYLEKNQIANLHGHMIGYAQTVRNEYNRQLELEPTARTTGWVELTTIKQFLDYYKPKFEDTMGMMLACKRLHDHKQTGTLNEYINAEIDIHGGFPFTEGELIFSFILGLNKNLQQEMWGTQCKSFSDLLTEVLHCDAAEKWAADSDRLQDCDAVDANVAESNNSKKIREMQQQIQQLQQALAQLMTNNSNVSAVGWKSGGRRQQQKRL